MYLYNIHNKLKCSLFLYFADTNGPLNQVPEETVISANTGDAMNEYPDGEIDQEAVENDRQPPDNYVKNRLLAAKTNTMKYHYNDNDYQVDHFFINQMK